MNYLLSYDVINSSPKLEEQILEKFISFFSHTVRKYLEKGVSTTFVFDSIYNFGKLDSETVITFFKNALVLT